MGQEMPLFALAPEAFRPPSNTWFLGPPELVPQMASIGSAILAPHGCE